MKSMFKFSVDSRSKASHPALIPDFTLKKRAVIDSSLFRNSSSSPEVVAVIIHCYYLDRLDAIGSYLGCLPNYDLFISVVDREQAPLVMQWASRLHPNIDFERRTVLKVVPNLGRDVKSFWEFSGQVSDNYKIFLKLHTKKSPHLGSLLGKLFGRKSTAHADHWFSSIMENLIPKCKSDLEVIEHMILRSKVGAIFPVPWYLFSESGWGAASNYYLLSALFNRLSIPLSSLANPLMFPVGNMYWGSTAFMSKWSQRIKLCIDYPSEPLPADGTILHAVERAVAYMCQVDGLSVVYSGSCGNRSAFYSWDKLFYGENNILPSAFALNSCLLPERASDAFEDLLSYSIQNEIRVGFYSKMRQRFIEKLRHYTTRARYLVACF